MKRKRWGWAAGLLLLVGYIAWNQAVKPLGAQQVTFQAALKNCGSDGPLRYCVYRDRAGVNGDLVYHLHGRNLDEQSWNDDSYFTALLQGQWQRAGVRPPTVVSISYGPVWLLTPKGRQPDSGLLDDLVSRLPALESRLGPVKQRMLVGESMGGLNVLILGLSERGRFDRVAALCPGVYVDSPFASLAELRAAAKRTGADPKIGFGIIQLARTYAADAEEWQRIEPLKLLDALAAGPQRPSLYLSCGLYDRYGNFEGTQLLADKARKAGFKTDWHPLYGGHCAVDVASLASFLVD